MGILFTTRMGFLFTITLGFLLTITMGILFTIVLGIQFTISSVVGRMAGDLFNACRRSFKHYFPRRIVYCGIQR